GKHAIDYLGSFDATETTSPTATALHANNNNPCADKPAVGSCNPSSPADTFLIPAATLVNCATSAGTAPATQIAGSFKIWGANSPNITGVSYVSENVVSGTGQCSTTVAITFTTNASGTVVLAWGGHIASQTDWGIGNSASAISGSPYHMEQDSLTTNGVNQSGVGSQDRALATSAIFFTPTISTLIKDANGATVTSVKVGTVVHDTATLSNASSNAGGTVTYSRFDNGSCSGTPVTTQTVTVTNGIVPDSSTFTPNAAGSYSYRADYSGDLPQGSNFAATGQCEPLTVTGVAATVVTEIHNGGTHTPVTSVPLGSIVHDQATVSGAFGTPTGSVDFTFYK